MRCSRRVRRLSRRANGNAHSERERRFQELCSAAECCSGNGTNTIGQPDQCGVWECDGEHGIDAACDVDLHGDGPGDLNSATLTGSGFALSGATFPVTLNPSLALTLEVQFDPTAVAAATGRLTIQSNSSTNSTVAISVSGTGEAVQQHQVDLSWVAPSSSPVQTTGYNIYRAPGGSTSYQQLNSSVVTQTTYVDSTVQAGSSYDYYVESVDSSGAQSAPSNGVAASVP